MDYKYPYYLPEADNRPAVKVWQTHGGAPPIIEIRTWIAKLIGRPETDEQLSHAARDYKKSWEKQWKDMYPGLAFEALNARETNKRKRSGQGVTLEYTATVKLVSVILAWAISSRRDEDCKLPSIGLLRSLMVSLMSKIGPTNIRLQSHGICSGHLRVQLQILNAEVS